MRRVCPVCGLQFEREPGYFMGAMYFSYGLGLVSAVPTCLYLFRLGVSDGLVIAAALLQLTLLSPLIFRYSRVLWLHLDQLISPR